MAALAGTAAPPFAAVFKDVGAIGQPFQICRRPQRVFDGPENRIEVRRCGGALGKLLQVDSSGLVAGNDEIRAGGEDGVFQRTNRVQKPIGIVPVNDAGQQQDIGMRAPDADAKADCPQRQPKPRADRPRLGSEQQYVRLSSRLRRFTHTMIQGRQ